MRPYRIALVIGGLAAGLLLAEIGARVLSWIRPADVATRSTPSAESSALSARVPLVHPYFGVSPRRQSAATDGPVQFQLPLLRRLVPEDVAARIRTNNHGFYSDHDYPHRGAPDDYIVGVFGGSVANYFSIVEGQRFARLLEQHPRWRDRHVVVLNFAQNGFKQPQQALVLAYFLGVGQRFDAVVALDGFNESALGFSENWQNGIDVSMPRAYPGALTERFSSPTDEQVAWQASMGAAQRTLARLRSWNDRVPSAAARLLLQVIEARVERRLAQLLAERPRPASALAAGFFAVPASPGREEAEGLSRAVDAWLAGSRTMGDISAGRNIDYVHVLQPNQYHTKHAFGDDERRVAIAAPYGYSESVRKLYPVMQRRLEELRRPGVDEVDGVDLFDRETTPVFLDNCCHYTNRGYDLMADLLVARLSGPARAPAATR